MPLELEHFSRHCRAAHKAESPAKPAAATSLTLQLYVSRDDWKQTARNWWHVSWDTGWRRTALVSWAVVLIVLAILAARSPRNHSVLPIFAQAGANWAAGQPLYGITGEAHDLFRYSPLAAALFAPLSLPPLAVTAALWRLLNAAVLILGFRWWLHTVLPDRLTVAQRAMLYLLILPMAISNLYNGQINPLMLGLLLAAVAAVQQQRFTLAAVLVGLAFWLKLYPVAIGLLLVLLYTRRFSLRLLLALVAGAVLPFVLQHPSYVLDEYRHWLAYLGAEDREAASFHIWLRDIRQLFLVLGMKFPRGMFPLVQLGIAAVLAAYCLAARWRRLPERTTLRYLTHLGCCWMTIFGPSTESPTWLLVLPSLAVELVLAWAEGGSVWRRGCLVLSFCLFFGTQLTKWFPLTDSVADYAPQPTAGLLLFGCVLATGMRRLLAGPARGNSVAAAAALSATVAS
jgi:hypothetical protein